MIDEDSIWTLVCDRDVVDMSEAVGKPYALDQFVRLRLAMLGSGGVLAVEPARRINAWVDQRGFAAQIEVLRDHQYHQIAQRLAQMQVYVGLEPGSPPAEDDHRGILRSGAALLRAAEARLAAGGQEADRLAGEAFRRTLADLSQILSGAVTPQSVFADITQPVPSAQLPDREAVDEAVAGRCFLVPVRLKWQ